MQKIKHDRPRGHDAESTIRAHNFKLNDMTDTARAFEAQRETMGDKLDAKFGALQTLEKVEKQTGVSEAHIADQLGSLNEGIVTEAKHAADGAVRHVDGFVANTSHKFNESMQQLSQSRSQNDNLN